MASFRSNRSKSYRMSKVARRASSNLLNDLQLHQTTELREFFRLIDTENKGTIEKEDLRTMLSFWNGSAPTEELMDEMLSDVRGVPFNKTMLLTLFAQKLRDIDTPDTIKNAFQCMDTENVGTVSAEELRVWLVTKGEHRLTDTEVDEIFSRMTIKDGRLEYDAFTKMLQNVPDEG